MEELQRHTVLGASGAMGRAVLDELIKKNFLLRAVTNDEDVYGIETIQADLRSKAEADEAIKDSDYVYLCVGLPYKTEVWKTDWEKLMLNVTEACAKYNAKLIFFDNIYMYQSELPVDFDEKTAQNPDSEKGKARKRAADIMMDAVHKGKIKGLIGRSADFFGKRAKNSILYVSFLERMLERKDPQFLTRTDQKHTFSFVSDNGRALVQLALNDDCYGQVWHLPTGKPITVNEILKLFNNELGHDYKISVISPFMRNLLSRFISPVKEVGEMLYQFEQDYVMC